MGEGGGIVMRRISKAAIGAGIAALVAASVFVSVESASAATYPGPYSGQRLCNVPKSAMLTTNSLSTAGIRFTNYDNLAKSYGFSVPAGYQQSSSAYTNTYWMAESAMGFYSVPTATCY